MINIPKQRPRHAPSPRKIHPPAPSSKGVDSVEREYQMRSNRNPPTEQRVVSKRISRQSSQERDKSLLRRKLSFKSRDGDFPRPQEYNEVRNCLQVKQLSVKQNRHPTSEELALQIEYHQFNQPPKEALQTSNKCPSSFKRRIHRIKSSDCLSLSKSTQSNSKELQLKIKLAQDQNVALRQLKSETLLKLEGIEQIYATEKDTFTAEIVSFQRSIQALSRKINNNRNQLSHIYSYPAFDPMKLVVKPIVELDGENSQMRSLIKTEPQFEELQYQSRLQRVTEGESDGKEEMTERTGPSSRQQYGELE